MNVIDIATIAPLSAADTKLPYGSEWDIKQKAINWSRDEHIHTQPSGLAVLGDEEIKGHDAFWKNPIYYKVLDVTLVTEQETQNQEGYGENPTVASMERTQSSLVPKVNIEEEDLLDWDAYIEPPPPKDSVTVMVKFKYVGRGKPLSVEDPRS